ncbi:imelysin family protein [Thalassobaculum sp. OXR-137]|uniref:imelysin family protein n=1 Tax=Thalassobaculum sp. OXR-137 TaxID=3100173 RepID=UPI002AC8EC5A|nr:imelysin family protein [Thalassobaculum sp. OXR-137]WPZ36062.1 imelysin family protein [Thalassobaculum sp. OXR-137]
MRVLAVLFAAVCLMSSTGARADVSAVLVEDLVDGNVIPAYRAFESKTAALSQAVDAACAQDALATETVKAVFAEAWIAWAGARHVVKGPVTYFDRQFRIEFWPDGRNRIERALNDLRVAGGEPEIAAAVVGVQGFPALERLIYEGEGANDCFIARPIAANLHGMAAEILIEWTEGDSPFRKALVSPGGGAGVYFSYSESLTALMTGAVASLEGILRLRLKRPLGEESGIVRPERAEAWRSGLSMDLIRADLATVADFYHGGAEEGEAPRGLDAALRDSGETDLADLMTKAFRVTRDTADKIDRPLREAVVDPALRPVLEELVTQVSALKALIIQKVGPALGIAGGFNALDGD